MMLAQVTFFFLVKADSVFLYMIYNHFLLSQVVYFVHNHCYFVLMTRRAQQFCFI